MSTRYILKLEGTTPRTMMKEVEGGYAADFSIDPGDEVIVPTSADGTRLVASGFYSWVEGEPKVNPET